MRARQGLIGVGLAGCLAAGTWTAGLALAETPNRVPAIGSQVVYPPTKPPVTSKPPRPPHKHHTPRPHPRPPHQNLAHHGGGLPFTGAAVALMTSAAVALVVAGLVMIAIRRRDAGR